MILASPSAEAQRKASSKRDGSHGLRVQVFADGANLETMLSLARSPLVKGFTTNPTLMRQSGVKDYAAFSKTLLRSIPDKPISFEVLADEPAEMRRQALLIAEWGENVYVKVPVTNSEGLALDALIYDLSHRGVKVNVTAVFTLDQVWSSCQALKGGAPSVVSVFAGRIADSGRDPVPHMRAALSMCRSVDRSIELLWASPREILNVVQADEIGVDIITVTDAILSKLSLLGKDLNEFSRDTVLMFKRDGESAGFTL
jgi:transaldolase